MQHTLSCSEPPRARFRMLYSAQGGHKTLKQKHPGATHGASPIDTYEGEVAVIVREGLGQKVARETASILVK